MNTVDVNRGYLKIEGAVRAFNFDFRGKTVLDIGSSTGGFTELALNRGAKKVIAVEKGSHQMKAPLRFDPRIELHEKTDIFNVRVQDNTSENRLRQREQLASEPRNDGRERSGFEEVLSCAPDVIVADVSFISLKPVLKHAKEHLSDKNTEFLVMLKPQFEAELKDLNRGVVKNEKIRRDIIKNFEQWLKQNDFIVINKRDNDIHGRNGNIERFYYLHFAKHKHII